MFERVDGDDYEQVVFCHDRASGLRAIIAIHSTALGPALGGTRFYPYASEDDALEDVLRLARGMTFKAAVAGLDQGGGKAVIIGDPSVLRSEALLRAYGRYVGSLGGRYLTAEDVGTTQADMDMIRRETRYVTGVSPSLGGSGDPSTATAWGLYQAMRATQAFVGDGEPSVDGARVCVLGVGKVGAALVGHLVEAGAKVTVADVSDPAVGALVERYGVVAVPAAEAHAVPCDIFSPCALGGGLNARTIPELRCRAVVGAANNQFAEAADADRAAERGIVVAPDYVVNAGGIVNIAEEGGGYDRERAWAKVARIADTLTTVLRTANDEGITPVAAADRLARRRIDAVARVQLIRPGH